MHGVAVVLFVGKLDPVVLGFENDMAARVVVVGLHQEPVALGACYLGGRKNHGYSPSRDGRDRAYPTSSQAHLFASLCDLGAVETSALHGGYSPMREELGKM
ncbi:hypothetical protein E2651_08250 [Streptomyces sp. MZ04]|nr:hypothetical protein E2651_08250 [Streptomyces sp. MZ04]